MRAQRILAAAVVITAFVATGCGGREGGGTESTGGEGGGESSVSSSFGDLSEVCTDGSASGASAQGVTDSEIKVGTFSDVGFTKVSEFGDAAKVFTSWCNDNGGINGRTLTATVRDTKFMAVRQEMTKACKEDFALVGGGAALDALGTKERLTCLLPNFPAQTSQVAELDSDLIVQASPSQTFGYMPYYQFRYWLVQEAYPDSANAVGIINADSPVSKVLGDMQLESTEAAGGTFVYNDLYPASGVSDWTPYAQSIKDKGVKGLIFYGQYSQLAKLESVLTGMNYKLDWIDANNNAYGEKFIPLLGPSADYQNNVVDLGGVLPLESDAEAMEQLKELYAKYAPGAEITMPAVRAFSAWLLFAKSAVSCGDDLTRSCVYDTATQESEWTAGGLQAAQNLAPDAAPSPCFNVEKATGDGWVAADFQPDDGAFRCDIPVKEMADTARYGSGMTLSDVGLSMGDVK
ncbi:ABC transporter substrate-binding protein [Gordonia sp. LSe1-13]|uniref:ABC transporter substrate-binding protein n=1 Tax=Gordonia sesuvii TaxID=3116777 RepID=A0ABU7M8R5_9ACTN|nr:ABC transporter substrate-binding protein [Gordonia sp. LSe1-13]